MQTSQALPAERRTPSPGLALVIAALAALMLWLLSPRTALADGTWTGQVAQDQANVRSGPSTADPVIATLDAGQPIEVARWVSGETVVGKNDIWGELAGGGYIYSGGIVKPKPATPPPAPAAPTAGHWIDVNLTQQIATAYDGATPVYWAVVSAGRPDWPSPVGTFPILRRVPNETMTSASLRVAVGAGDSYDIPNVLYTQYLTEWGHAIHDNYWKWDSPFGVPTSHGCVGMVESDAKFFWDWATIDTPVVVHE